MAYLLGLFYRTGDSLQITIGQLQKGELNKVKEHLSWVYCTVHLL